jgi:azurin
MRNSNIKTFVFFLICSVAVIGTLGLVACSGGQNGGETGQEQSADTKSATEGEPRVIEIEGLDSLKFSVTSISAKPGEEITVKLVNNSSMPANAMSHNFVLLKAETDPAAFNKDVLAKGENGNVPEEMTDGVIAKTGLVAGGESDSVTFTVPEEPGEYTYICTFPGHFAAGMKGTLTVK